MAVTKEQQTTTETKEVVVATFCDLCQQEFQPNEGDEVKVERSTGGQHGGETLAFDVCTECWNKQIIPFFAKRGSSTRLIA